MRTLTASEFKLRFADSALGYVWTLAKPLMLFGVMYVVFSEMLRFGADIEHYPLVLLMGIMLWGFYSEATAGAVTILVSRADLIRKASFPHSTLATSVVATSFAVFSCNLVALVVLATINGVYPHASWLLLPLLMGELALLTIGTSLLLSGLFVFLRDIGQLWSVALQLLFYATPIIYPLELLDQQGVSQFVQQVLLMNPVAQIVQDSRVALVGGPAQSAFDVLGPEFIAIPYAITIATLAGGLFVYRRNAGRLAEHV